MNALAKPETGGLLALAVVILILPIFLPNSFYYDVVILVGINAIVCVGLNLLIGYAGQISLGHAGFFALGAYFSGILVSHHDWPPLGAMLSGALFVAILSYVLARPIMKLRGHYLAMGTLGMGIVISIVLNQEGDLTGGPDGMPVSGFSVFGWEPAEELTWYWMVGGLLMVAVWLALNLINSPVGRALRAVHGSEVAASVAGVNVARYKILVFVVSAVFASIAGSLFAHYSGFLTPSEADFFHSIELVTMVVLGGMASIFGAVVGAAVLTTLPQLLTVFHDYEMLVYGAVMMVTMIFMRRGLVPTLQGLFRRHRK